METGNVCVFLKITRYAQATRCPGRRIAVGLHYAPGPGKRKTPGPFQTTFPFQRQSAAATAARSSERSGLYAAEIQKERAATSSARSSEGSEIYAAKIQKGRAATSSASAACKETGSEIRSAGAQKGCAGKIKRSKIRSAGD